MALYNPGKNPVLNSAQILANPITGIKRPLQSDEFIYYKSFLFDEDFALPIKGAIAVVLKADLIKLYKKSYEMFLDSDVENWVGYYKTLSGLPKQLADSEIYYFDSFLKDPKMPLESYYPGTVEQIVHSIAVNNKKIQEYQGVAVSKNEKTFIEEFWKNKQLNLEEEKKTKDLTDHLTKSDPAISFRKDKWIGQNLVAYMAGYFVRHPLSIKSDSKKATWEFRVREDMLKSVRVGLMSATDALAYYITALDLIAGIDNENDFLNKLHALKRPLPEHPMLKHMYRGHGI